MSADATAVVVVDMRNPYEHEALRAGRGRGAGRRVDPIAELVQRASEALPAASWTLSSAR